VTAAERFKWVAVNAIERVCLLEEQLEAALKRIAELEAAEPEQEDDGLG
jgi:hypothetical protein